MWLLARWMAVTASLVVSARSQCLTQKYARATSEQMIIFVKSYVCASPHRVLTATALDFKGSVRLLEGRFLRSE